MIATLPTEVICQVLAFCDRRTLSEDVRLAGGRLHRIVDRHFATSPAIHSEQMDVNVGQDAVTVNDQPWTADTVEPPVFMRVDRVNVTYALATQVPTATVEKLFGHVAKLAAGAHLNVGVASGFKGAVRLPPAFEALCASAKSVRVWPMAAGTVAAVPLGRRLFANALSVEVEKLSLKSVDEMAANADAVADWLNAEAPKQTADYRFGHLMQPETVYADGPALRELKLSLQHADAVVFPAVVERLVQRFMADQVRRRYLLVVSQAPNCGRQPTRQEFYVNDVTGERLIVTGGCVQRLMR